MFSRIEQIRKKYLIGMFANMTLESSQQETFNLWNKFMKARRYLSPTKNNNLYSVQVYNDSISFENFNENTVFKKWACVEVDRDFSMPSQMNELIIFEGKYAVFNHVGTPQTFYKTHNFIFNQWLPNSEFELDNRPHFQIMTEEYSPNDVNAKEEVWIPIK